MLDFVVIYTSFSSPDTSDQDHLHNLGTIYIVCPLYKV